MIALFAYLYYVPWPAFEQAVDQGDVVVAAARLGTIRTIVLTNLILGLLTGAIGSSGRYWS